MQGLLIVGGRVRGTVADEPGSPASQLTDYVGQVLQVRNLTILMGAGASFHLGSPQIRNLSNEAISTAVGATTEALTEKEASALEALNPEDKGDLEKLLTTLQSALAFAGATGADSVQVRGSDHEVSDMAGLRRKLNHSLAAQCTLPAPGFPKSGSQWEAHQTFFSRLLRARRSDLPRPRVFTTNYDLVIERSLDALGIPYIDGFSGTVDRRLNLDTYSFDLYRTHAATQDVVARIDSMLHLYKLHGSLNWRFNSKLGQLEAQGGTAGAPDSDELILIYPTPAKESDTLAFPYSDLFRLFSNSLQGSDTALLCIGYGFADDHLNRIITGSLGSNQSLSLLLVDPNGVYGSPDLLVGLTADTGTRANEVGVQFVEGTGVAAFASVRDSRVSLITGKSGRFQEFAELVPDPDHLSSAPPGEDLLVQLQDLSTKLGLAGPDV